MTQKTNRTTRICEANTLAFANGECYCPAEALPQTWFPIPVVSTNKKGTFVYQTKVPFLNDVCLRQMMQGFAQ